MADAPAYDNLLIGAGAMKAGTTWIYDALQHHPDIHFCREKEIHYFYARHVNAGVLSDRARMQRAKGYLEFDPAVSSRKVLQARVDWVAKWLDAPPNGAVDDAWFNALFAQRGTATWSAEFSNLSALLPAQAWADIHARARKLRVIYTLRAPMDRLWSHLRFHLKLHGRLAELDAWSLDEIEDHIRTGGDYLDHNDYAGTVARMQDALPPECLHIDVFDSIVTQPRAFIADLERFIGIPPRDLPDALIAKVVNPSPKRPLPQGLYERFQPEITQQIQQLRAYGIPLPDHWGEPLA